MKRVIPSVIAILLTLTALAWAGGSAKEGKVPAASPLAPFERIVGGEWKIEPLRHVFEWGAGFNSVHSRSYDETGNLSASGIWFWHPGRKEILGYSIDASGGFFAEMRPTFSGDTMTNHLTTFSPDGKTAEFVGIWNFVGKDRYEWTLYKKTPEGDSKIMEAPGIRQ